MTIGIWSSRTSTTFLSKGTTWDKAGGPRKSPVKLDDVEDVIDLDELGVEIYLKDGSKLTFKPDTGMRIIIALREEIKRRPDPLERVELWEAMVWEKDIYEGGHPKEGRIYSYEKERKILRSRMTPEEREKYFG